MIHWVYLVLAFAVGYIVCFLTVGIAFKRMIRGLLSVRVRLSGS